MENNGPGRRGALSVSTAFGKHQSPNEPPPSAGPVTWEQTTIPKLEEGDDVKQYLTTFECLTTACRLAWQNEPSNWCHTDKQATNAYAAMDMNKPLDYGNVVVESPWLEV